MRKKIFQNKYKALLFSFFLSFFISPNALAQASDCVDDEVKIGSISYNSIQAAVNASSSGDIITLGSGVFDESVMIRNKDNRTIISECFAEVQKIRVVNSDNFTLRNLFIRTPDGVAGSALVLSNVQTANIENTHIFNSANNGVKVDRNSSDILFSKVFVYNNDSGFALGNGVDVTIKDSRVYGNRNNGIFLNDVSSLLIENTEVYNNTRHGITTHYVQSTTESVSGSIALNNVAVYANGMNGIGLRSHHKWHISNSDISMNLGDGLHIKKVVTSTTQDGDIVENTIVSRNGSHGVYLQSSQPIEFTRNEITQNSGYGVYHSNTTTVASKLLFKENTISNNNGSLTLPAFHSKDLYFYNLYLDNTDTGNQTTQNSEGLGVGNYRPQALAGEDVSFALPISQAVKLSAKDSYDLDGNNLSYTWSLISSPAGSSTVLQDANSVVASLSPDTLGDYEIELLVSDGKQSSTDRIRVSSNSLSPKAVAGANQLSSLGQSITLNGSGSSDADSTNLNYTWSFVRKPIGSEAEITNSTSQMASFTIDKPGDYEISLMVSDGSLASTDNLIVSTENIPPHVEIATPSIALATAFNISATVTDAQTDISYKWSVLSAPSGENVFEFSNTETKDTSFTALKPGVYIIQLRADDGIHYSQDILFLDIENQAPTADAGMDISSATTGNMVNVSASGSDPEGHSITYQWSFTSKPTGSMAVIGDSKKEDAFFLPDKAGTYTLSVKVSDGFSSASATMNVTVTDPTNAAPVLGSIGNKSVNIGNELKFQLTATDSDTNDIVHFMASPMPLSENMTFNSKTGEFFFKPRAHQAGTYNLSFQAIDKLGDSDSENITITVNTLTEGATTSVTGSVLDANDKTSSTPQDTPLVGIDVRLSIRTGTTYDNTHGAMTDSTGNFTINNIPSGDEYIVQILTSGLTNSDDDPIYGDFHEQIEVITGASNVITRPFYMPKIDYSSGVATVTPGQATQVSNTIIGAEMTIPADTAMMNGMAFDGKISISQVPESLAPVALPEELEGTAMLITIQPAGLRFMPAVPITFKNIDNLPAGSEMDIYSVNPDTGLFAVSGRGRVTTDGTKIETISGGVTAATWHTPGGPGGCGRCCGGGNGNGGGPGSPGGPGGGGPPGGGGFLALLGAIAGLDETENSGNLLGMASDFNNDPMPSPPSCREESNRDCETCEGGSSVDLLSGELREEHSLASYRSLNQERILTLGYSSKLAYPSKVLSFERFYPVVNAIPLTVSSKIRMRGFTEGREIFTNARTLSEDMEMPFIQKDLINLSSLYTSIYRTEQVATSNYQFSRFASSRVNYISVVNGRYSFYGIGWSVSNLQRVYPTQTGDILLVSGNGFHSQFRVLSGNQHLAFQIDTSMSYRSPPGDYSTFKRVSNSGYVRTMKDGMVYNFNRLGLLLSEVDRNGNKTVYCYYPNSSRLKCIKDPNGMEYTFTYGTDNYLDSITDPQGRVTSFEHDSSGHLIRITDPDNTTREFSYNDKSLMTAQMDKRGNLANYIYNDYNQVIRTIRSDGTGINLLPQIAQGLRGSESEGTETQPLSVLLSENKQGTYTDSNGDTSEFVLNDRGQFTKTTDPLGRETDIERDVDGNRTELITPRSFVWDYTYDEMGNQTTARQRETGNETNYTYEPNFNQIASITRPNGDVTNFEYDTKGNLIKLILPDSSFYTFKHNRAGLMTERKDPLGHKTKYFYHRLTGNLIAQRDSLRNTALFDLDPAGNIIQITDPNGHFVKREYDNLNRLTKNIDAEAGESLYSYDNNGNLMSLTDGRNKVTTYVYDVLNRLIERTNPLNQTEYFSYDNEGYMTGWLNRKGFETRYIYDSANQLIRKELGSENTYIYSYDMDGNIIGLLDDDSNLFYEYDELDRVLSVSTKNSPKQPAITQRYTYDNNSNRTSLRAGFSADDTGEFDEDNDFDISYTYDLENQLTDIGSPAGNFHFEYDDLSRIVEMTYPNDIRTEMNYEGDVRLSKVEHIKEGTFFDSIQSFFSYTYDNFNNRTSMKTFRRTLPINSPIDYTYDKKDQLLTATNPLMNQTNEVFTYDITGNRLRKSGQTTDSVYNDNNQLTDDQTYTYTYDDSGNLIQKIHKTSKATTKYDWDIENRLIQVTKHETEDALPSETITYAYDALGRRIEKNINGNIKRYVYDNEDILMEFNKDNLFQKFYLHGLGIDEPLAMLEDNTDTEDTEDLKAHYYHKDGLGSITSITDDTGNEKEKYVYDAFGKATIFDEEERQIASSQLGNPYFFTGREYDNETGLQYHRARYYDLDLGRWISEDPIEFNSGDENLYRYTLNNPVNWFDPNGLDTYKCRRNFKGVNFKIGVFSHSYICTDNAGRPTSCIGFNPGGLKVEDPFLGDPECEKIDPGKCSIDEFDNCMRSRIPIAKYNVIVHNCHQNILFTENLCRLECL